MMVGEVFEAVAGILLVFLVPGYALTRAIFPEWRIEGFAATRRLLEMLTLSFVLSVVLTVLVGYLLLAAAPGGFQAYWNAPVLEAILAAVTLVGLVVAVVRGAFARTPPIPSLDPSGGEEGAWELMRRLDQLGREERRLQHALRAQGGSESAYLRSQLEEIRAESAKLRRAREAEYAE